MSRRRFVVQYHIKNALDRHYDLMLEREGKLATWSFPFPLEPGTKQRGMKIFDHRLKYLTFEGEIGRGLGRVSIWEQGEYVAYVWESEKVEGVLLGERCSLLFSLHYLERDWWLLKTEAIKEYLR